MTSDAEIKSEIERLDGELRTFRRAHRLFREQVKDTIVEGVAALRNDLENLAVVVATQGGLMTPADSSRMAALLALTSDRALELRLHGLDQAPDDAFSPLTVGEFQEQVDAFEAKIASLRGQLRDRERERAHEAVDAEFAS